jgi:hypothetical protein
LVGILAQHLIYFQGAILQFLIDYQQVMV